MSYSSVGIPSSRFSFFICLHKSTTDVSSGMGGVKPSGCYSCGSGKVSLSDPRPRGKSNVIMMLYFLLPTGGASSSVAIKELSNCEH